MSPAAAKSNARGRSANGDRKYDEIVEVAGRLFAEKGFDGTSLKDISEQVGVLKGSLYHHITSKEDLLEEVIRVGQEGIVENLLLCETFAENPLEQLVAFCYGHVRLNATPERLVRGVVFLRDGDKLTPRKRTALNKRRDEYDHYLRNILDQAQAQGLIDPDVHSRICSFAIFGVVTSYIRWYRPGGPMTPHEIGREFAAFALASVRRHESFEAGHRWEIVDDVIDRANEWLVEEGLSRLVEPRSAPTKRKSSR